MAKRSGSMAGLPHKAADLIRRIGADLRVSRLRRGVAQKDLAGRMFVSVQTLRRIESGDPSVSIGIWMTCAFCLNRLEEVRDIFLSSNDVYGNVLEKRKRARQRKARGVDRDQEVDLDF